MTIGGVCTQRHMDSHPGNVPYMMVSLGTFVRPTHGILTIASKASRTDGSVIFAEECSKVPPFVVEYIMVDMRI